MKPTRVRFAPSPTGPLHIGGLRTALYNYLFAKKHGGTFILRIEDTDQSRFIEGAEEYICHTLNWCGLQPDEGPGVGGNFGPYRQSERKGIYQREIKKLIDNGHAYYAFDTPEEIEVMRKKLTSEGQHSPKYNFQSRNYMCNSLSLTANETNKLLNDQMPYTIRLKIDPNQVVAFDDIIRGEVVFQSSELDDKVLMKSDGLPTYHFANVIDDFSMKISHVIRGEEWLSSTAHHILLYQALGWKEFIPKFSHLPLILKPTGKGKLSKRDGQKLGIPVFPMNWEAAEDIHSGFKEMGFLPEAVINFLAFLGWSPGTERELYPIKDLISDFSLKNINKGGARFDFDKAKWFNQQYILGAHASVLSSHLNKVLITKGIYRDKVFIQKYVELFRPRIKTLNELYSVGSYFFEDIAVFNEKIIRKKWKEKGTAIYQSILAIWKSTQWKASELKLSIEQVIQQFDGGYGDILPLLRIAISGDTKGPDLFETLELMGDKLSTTRLDSAAFIFDEIKKQS